MTDHQHSFLQGTPCTYLQGRADKMCELLCRQAITHIILRELNRPSLHAKTLGFIHPVSMKRLNFTSELPQDLRSALIALREI